MSEVSFERRTLKDGDLKSIDRENFKTEEEDVQKVFGKKGLTPQKLIIKLADLHDSLNDSVVDINQCFCFGVSSISLINFST